MIPSIISTNPQGEQEAAMHQNTRSPSRKSSTTSALSLTGSSISGSSVQIKKIPEYAEVFMRQRISKLDSSRILLAERTSEILREKDMLRDLGESEKVARRIIEMDRANSEKILEIQKLSLSKNALEVEFEVLKKHVDSVI
jgi:hypothetical protein